MKASDVIASLALIVSLLVAGFSIYQFEHADSEARIVAAIDVSRKYLEDTQLPNQLATYRREKSPSDSSNRLLLRLNYIAYLANTNRLDGRYLSLQIGCDMKEVYNVHGSKKSYSEDQPSDGFSDVVEVDEIKQFLLDRHACFFEGNINAPESTTETFIKTK
jgi:hypothetical protein